MSWGQRKCNTQAEPNTKASRYQVHQERREPSSIDSSTYRVDLPLLQLVLIGVFVKNDNEDWHPWILLSFFNVGIFFVVDIVFTYRVVQSSRDKLDITTSSSSCSFITVFSGSPLSLKPLTYICANNRARLD
jgi:hypothetical protein